MKLTSRSEYALLALVYLARHEGEDYLSVDTVAQAQGIPPKFLEQILLALKARPLFAQQQGPARRLSDRKIAQTDQPGGNHPSF